MHKNIKIIATIFTIFLAISSVMMVLEPATAAPKANAGLLDPKAIPKYTNQITGAPPVYTPEYSTATTDYYTIDVTAFQQQVLPTIDAKGTPTNFGKTTVWGYGGQTASGYIANSPGPSFEATKGRDIYVRYQNKLTEINHLFAVDPTLHWANPTNIPMTIAMSQAMAGLSPVYPPGYNGVQQVAGGITLNPKGWNAQTHIPIIPHLHGGEVKSTSDGNPEAWFTADGIQGTGYNTELIQWVNPNTGIFDVPVLNNEAVFNYPNSQPATTLWYHDHALGITRLNVMSGLAGFYLLRDTADTAARRTYIPPVQYEMPIVIQDRIFTSTGQFFYPSAGINPDHPYWIPEFFGNTIMVNGLVWPNMNVDQGQYRLRLLDGSNARFYTLSFNNKMPFTVIGSDGGYLPAPVTVTELTMGPGERYDVIVDFTNVPAGTKLIMKNTAQAPFKGGGGGTPADPQTVGQIMQFTVTPNAGWIPTSTIPTTLNTIPVLPTSTTTRQLTLMEVMGMGGPLEVLLDGKKWTADISENVTLGSTETWVIVNPTADTHPIHLHLTQFQLVSRQPFQVNKYAADWTTLNGMAPVPDNAVINNPPYQLYTQGKIVGPNPQETGWKDTIQANPGEITIIQARFAPIDGTANYPFDATNGPGYVWHCHILDHEDNEMMRPYTVIQ